MPHAQPISANICIVFLRLAQHGRDGYYMPSNFAFLREKFPVLANFGGLAEQYCYTDANSCLIKLGMIGETIVNLIFTYDHIDAPCDDNAAEKINMLYRMELIDKDLCDILHSLRKNRNKAAH